MQSTCIKCNCCDRQDDVQLHCHQVANKNIQIPYVRSFLARHASKAISESQAQGSRTKTLNKPSRIKIGKNIYPPQNIFEVNRRYLGTPHCQARNASTSNEVIYSRQHIDDSHALDQPFGHHSIIRKCCINEHRGCYIARRVSGF